MAEGTRKACPLSAYLFVLVVQIIFLSVKEKNYKHERLFNTIQDGSFWRCSRMEGETKRLPLLKICHTYPTMIKLDTVIPCLKKIQEIYKSRHTPLDFC